MSILGILNYYTIFVIIKISHKNNAKIISHPDQVSRVKMFQLLRLLGLDCFLVSTSACQLIWLRAQGFSSYCKILLFAI